MSLGVLVGGSVQATAPGFNVQAILPESQVNKDVSYFDLQLEPNQQERLEIEISNNSDEPVEVEVSANSATTNMNGVIDYGMSNQPADESLVIPFSDIATVEESNISLASQETKTIAILVQMPDTAFEGIVLGGITVSEKRNDDEQENQVMNLFSYSLAVVISQSTTDLDSLVNLKGVQVEQRNRRNVIVASIQNPIAKILNDVSVEAKVYKGNQSDPMYHAARSDMRMAPNSTLDFGISTNDQRLQPGKYKLVLVVSSEEESWEFEQEFEITGETARELNQTAVNLATDNTVLYLWIALGISLMIIAIFIVAKLVKKKKSEKK